jgi:hypothetical protein
MLYQVAKVSNYFSNTFVEKYLVRNKKEIWVMDGRISRILQPSNHIAAPSYVKYFKNKRL